MVFFLRKFYWGAPNHLPFTLRLFSLYVLKFLLKFTTRNLDPYYFIYKNYNSRDYMVVNFYNNDVKCRISFLIIIFIIINSSLIFSQKVRIMPLGDSITRDSFGDNPRPDSILTGYRQLLWQLLQSQNYPVDFIGSDSSGYGVIPKFDPNNAGFGGYSTKQLLNLLKTGYDVSGNQVTQGPYFNYYKADIILLHIGTNELDTATADLEELLNYIDNFQDTTNSIIWVILAKIINRAPYSLATTEYNSNIQKMAEKRIKNGDHLKIVDMEKNAGFIYQIDTVAPYNNGDMYDYLHPNNRGYGKMASLFYDTLRVLLNQIIPVELNRFYYSTDKDSVMLYWETALELNNYGFVIERSAGDGIWQSIDFIRGKDNSNKIQKYFYQDVPTQPFAHNYMYRLRQIENNGTSQYIAQLNVNINKTTSIDSITHSIPKYFKLEQNYPNPFNPTTIIRYSIPKESKVSIEIYNSLGQKVFTLVDEREGAGIYEKMLNAQNLSSGVYFYIFKAFPEDGQNPINLSKKMILIK